jgi:hypothetical protein
MRLLYHMARLSILLAHNSMPPVDKYSSTDCLGNGTQATPMDITKDSMGRDIFPDSVGENTSARSLGRAAVSSPVGHVSSPASREETHIHTPMPLGGDLTTHSHLSLPQML